MIVLSESRDSEKNLKKSEKAAFYYFFRIFERIPSFAPLVSKTNNLLQTPIRKVIHFHYSPTKGGIRNQVATVSCRKI